MAMLKRALSAVLALTLLLSCVPMTVAAAETDEPTIVTEEPAQALPGETVEETVEITEAPAETVEKPTEGHHRDPTEATETPAEESTEPVTGPIEAGEATASQKAMNECHRLRHLWRKSDLGLR